MTVHRMKDYGGHCVAVQASDDRFGPSWRAVCLDCDYRSGCAGQRRASDIADEHRTKTAGTWKAAR